MNKTELIAALAEKTGTSKAEAGRAVDAVTSIIGETLKSGDNVALIGFGTFQVTKKAAREGRNPATGKAIQIAARNAPVFKAGQTLKDKVN